MHRKSRASRPRGKHITCRWPVLLTHERAVKGYPGGTAVDGVELGVRYERMGHPFEVYGRDPIISVKEKEPVVLSLGNPGIPSGPLTPIGLRDHASAGISLHKLSSDFARCVARSIINHNCLPVWVGLSNEGL